MTKPLCGEGDMSPALELPLFPDRGSWTIRDIVSHHICMKAEYKTECRKRGCTEIESAKEKKE